MPGLVFFIANLFEYMDRETGICLIIPSKEATQQIVECLQCAVKHASVLVCSIECYDEVTKFWGYMKWKQKNLAGSSQR